MFLFSTGCDFQICAKFAVPAGTWSRRVHVFGEGLLTPPNIVRQRVHLQHGHPSCGDNVRGQRSVVSVQWNV